MNEASKKSEIRSRLLLARKGLSAAERNGRSAEIAARLIATSEFKSARSIHFYLAMADEVDTEAIVAEAFRSGKRVVVPVIDSAGRSLALSELKAPEVATLQTGRFGIRAPRPEHQREVALESVDLWVLPGVAFDERGGRLGLGAGYYDRLLPGSRGTRIGLAYDFQVTAPLPMEKTDQPVDLIVTEKRIIFCKEGHGGGKN